MPRAAGLHSVTRRGRGAELTRPASDFTRMRKAATVKRTWADMPISNASSTRPYDGAELRAHVRPGAMDAMALPSRVHDRLHYRDGRVTDMRGNPIPTTNP